MTAQVEQGVGGRIDRQVTSEYISAHRTGAILHIDSLAELKGPQPIPMLPATASYDLIGRILRGEVRRSGELVTITQTLHNRSLTEEVLGVELYPEDKGQYRSFELSYRTLRRTDGTPDNVPSFHVNPKDEGLRTHFDVIYLPEGSEDITMTVPRNVERLADGQYIADHEVETITLHAGDLVAMSAVPYALAPVGDEAKFLYISSDSHLKYPGHRNPEAFPVEVAGEENAAHSKVLYVKGHEHKGLIGGRVNGISGPEIALPRNKYPTLRESAKFELYDMRQKVGEKAMLDGGQSETTVFTPSAHKEQVEIAA